MGDIQPLLVKGGGSCGPVGSLRLCSVYRELVCSKDAMTRHGSCGSWWLSAEWLAPGTPCQAGESYKLRGVLDHSKTARTWAAHVWTGLGSLQTALEQQLCLQLVWCAGCCCAGHDLDVHVGETLNNVTKAQELAN